MTKKQKPDRLVAEPKEEGLAVFSYDGVGLALRIGDNDMDTVFEVAKEAIKKQQQKSETDFKDENPKEKENETREAISDESSERSSINGRQEEGEEVRTEGEERSSEATEPVAGDTSTGGVSSEVHGPEESDVR